MHRDWLLWQLVDSAFPTGGFAHSSGLEAAKQARQILDEEDLVAFSQAVLLQAVETALPYVISVYRQPELFTAADLHCDAFLANPVANRASQAQGNGLLAAASAAFPQQPFRHWRKRARQEEWPCHLAPIYGRILQQLQVPLEDVERSFLFVTLRTILSAAIRLNAVGPLRSQALQQELAPFAQQLLQQQRPSDFHRVAQPAPVLDVWQSSHDRLYSRLFHS